MGAYLRGRAEPSSIGIDDSTCEVTTSRANPWKLPISPPSVELDKPAPTPTPNCQRQSAFFNLPPEIRQQIYTELLGNKRVHIDFSFHRRPGWLDAPKERMKEYKPQWRWFHHVCSKSDGFHHEQYGDDCPQNTGDEPFHDLSVLGFTSRKLEGVAWLRSCRKA